MNNDVNNIAPGDLVWVPSEVTLYKFREEDGTLGDFFKTPQPVNLLVSEVFDNALEVHYDGKKWEVKIRDVYPLIEVSQ